MANNFCKFLTHGYSFSERNKKLVVKPCCWFKDPVDYSLHDTARQQWTNIDSWTNACGVCKQLELSQGKSFRQSSFDIVGDAPIGPAAVDINLDFNCNAACVICDANSSSTWANQLKKYKIHYFNTDSLSHLLVVLKDIDLSLIRRIKFFGGEPLLTDTHIKILEQLPNPELVEIWYTTNASILPDEKLLELWGKFKLVFLECSIDGVGDRFKYIRWPLAWDKIRNNLLEMRDAAPVNILFRINHTLNPFNILFYDELENWVNKEFSTNRVGDAVEINVHPCWGVWDLSKTPDALREEVYAKYSYNHHISQLLQTLPVNSFESITEFTKTWDEKRNMDWKLIFPELINYF